MRIAVSNVLQAAIRVSQLPGPRQAALQNFPVRDALFAALLALLVEGFRHERREFFHGWRRSAPDGTNPLYDPNALLSLADSLARSVCVYVYVCVCV